MEPCAYDVRADKMPRIFEKIENYEILNIEVENAASLLDDMLNSLEEKMGYIRRLLVEGNVDKDVLVVRDGKGLLVFKMENVVEIRIIVRDYKVLMDDFQIGRGG
jgi:hypothetical protein